MSYFARFWRERSYCEFWKRCPLFTKYGHTCTHGGGNYCGRYRKMKHDEAKKFRDPKMKDECEGCKERQYSCHCWCPKFRGN